MISVQSMLVLKCVLLSFWGADYTLVLTSKLLGTCLHDLHSHKTKIPRYISSYDSFYSSLPVPPFPTSSLLPSLLLSSALLKCWLYLWFEVLSPLHWPEASSSRNPFRFYRSSMFWPFIVITTSYHPTKTHFLKIHSHSLSSTPLSTYQHGLVNLVS